MGQDGLPLVIAILEDSLDLSIFATAEAWISLATLLFLEIVLGIDNLVFISITSNRLPAAKQHIGRRLGLAGALIMRILFLSFASYLVHMTNPLFTVAGHGVSVRDLVMLLGGAYLIYKGVAELRGVLSLNEVWAQDSHEAKKLHQLGLPQAVGTIMVMDVVFSIDSVITAVGMVDHLVIMIIAVIVAIVLMMCFVDVISDFINKNVEMTILALTFITLVGVLLVVESTGWTSGVEVLGIEGEKFVVYFAMVFSVVLEFIQLRYNKNLRAYRASQEGEED